MKILVIFSFRNSFRTWKHVGNLDREMKFYTYLEKKYHCEFYFFTYGDLEDKKIAASYSKRFKVFPLYEFKKRSRYKFVTFIQSLTIPFKLKSEIQNIDIIKSNQLTAGWTSLICKINFRKPLYLRTGYDAYIFSKNEKKSKLKQSLFYLLTQFLLFFSDHYTVSSSTDLKFISNNYFIPKNMKISLSSNWVEYIKSSLDDFDSRKNQSILSVGRLESQKNYKFIIETLSNTDIELDIIGTGSMENELIQLANNVNTKLNLYKNLPNTELMEVYKKYKFFILPSIFEGNPKVLLEAMSTGCIPMVSNIKNNTEIIDDGFNGYVFDLNTNGQDKIINLLNNENDFNKISENAIDTIKTRVSVDKIATQEMNDLQKLISKN